MHLDLLAVLGQGPETALPENLNLLVGLILGLPLLGFLLNGALSLWQPRAKAAVSVIGAGVLLGAFAAALVAFRQVAPVWQADPEAAPIITFWSWLPVGDLKVDFSFLLDQLSMVMLLVVTGVGSLIHLFSIGYMKADDGYPRYFAYLNLFVAFMLVLVLGASFPMMFIGWEGVGLCSYLLIGFWFSEKANADAGKKAFIVNRIGDFGFLIAMFLMWQAFGSLNFTDVFSRAGEVLPAGSALVTAITLFLFLGCTGKSAQIPLYTWLPDAMAGPTPVSALIHAATMVTAGVYLVARANVLFALAPVSQTVVAGVGALTALVRRHDRAPPVRHQARPGLFDRLPAGVHVSGRGDRRHHRRHLPPCHPRLLQGAALPRFGKRDPRDAPRISRHPLTRRRAGHAQHGRAAPRICPVTATLMWIATLAIAGIPPFAGFFSKDEILAFAFGRGEHEPIFRVFWAMGATAACSPRSTWRGSWR